MRTKYCFAPALMAGLVGLAGVARVEAELPAMKERKWLGYFLGFENKKVNFGVTPKGRASIKVIGKKGEPLGHMLAVAVDFRVEEIMPDGTAKTHFIQPESLESDQEATDKPDNVVIRGTAAGGAKFEAVVHEERGAIELGGRLVDPGTLKNPRFSVQVVFQDVYSKSVPAGDEKKIEAFQEKIADDRVLLVLKDGKRVKLSPAEAKDAAEINGPGIEVMEMEMAAYQDNEFEITATGESAMTVTTAGSAAPINKGFTLTWVADPAKDAGNKARLRIEVK